MNEGDTGDKENNFFFLWIFLYISIAKLSLSSIKHTSGGNERIETLQREKSRLQYI